MVSVPVLEPLGSWVRRGSGARSDIALMNRTGEKAGLGDPFALLLTQESDPAKDTEPNGQGTLPIEMPPGAPGASKPKRKNAKEDRLSSASAYLYGPDHTLADLLGRMPDESAFHVGEFRDGKAPRTSSLPAAVLASSHLPLARELCDYLAAARAMLEDADVSRPTNVWVQSADLLLRADKYTPSEVETVIDYLAARGSLTHWVKSTYILRSHMDEILTQGAFSLWVTKNGRVFPAEKVDAARSRNSVAQGPGNARLPRNGLIATPSGVQDQEHASGGRREATF